MNVKAEEILQTFLDQLDELMSPVEGKIAFGNLRKQVSEWEDEKGRSANIAILYETPGGSTNQINIAFHFYPPAFYLVNEITGEEEGIASASEALERVREYIQAIPAKRRLRLQTEIDSWCKAGKTQSEIFASLNKLLYCNFRGACITTEELQEATRYAISSLRGLNKAGGSAGNRDE